MKRFLKIIVLILIISTSRIKGVKAESFYEDNWITGVYANLVDGNFSKPQLMRFIRRKSDNQASYCLTPRVLLYEDEIYDVADLNLTEEQDKRIKKIAYFGYGYSNHTSNEWYAITQFMIWKTVEPNMDIFFTDKFKGNRITRFIDEINELENLINQYDIKPNISITDLKLNYLEQVEDSNNVIKDYKINKTNGIDVSIDNNTIYIKSTIPGNHTIEFNKEYNLYNNDPIYYKASRGQNILVPGNLKANNYKLNINVSKANVVLTKSDTNTEEVLEGAEYGLYDSNYNLVNKLVTDEQGKAVFTDLMPGVYNFLEIKAPIGYQVDNTYHDFIVDDAYEYIFLNDDRIKADVYLNKYISMDGIILPEKNIEFEIYDLDDNLITNLTTNNKGVASINLEYGKYKIHQVNTTEGFNKVNDFYIDINNNEDKIYYLNDIKIEEKFKKELKNKEEEKKEQLSDNNLEEKNNNLDIKEELKENKVDNNPINNPKTLDSSIYIYIIVGYISFIVLLYLIACIKDHKE